MKSMVQRYRKKSPGRAGRRQNDRETSRMMGRHTRIETNNVHRMKSRACRSDVTERRSTIRGA